MDDPMAMAAVVEEHVPALTGFSMELTIEDLQIWTKTYKEDKATLQHIQSYARGKSTKMYT